jgi:hypothetical protein
MLIQVIRQKRLWQRGTRSALRTRPAGMQCIKPDRGQITVAAVLLSFCTGVE